MSTRLQLLAVAILLSLPLVLGCSAESRATETHQPTADASPARATPPSAELPRDLRTRKDGADWPAFRGPAGDGTSSETGLLLDWPASGPRQVWQRPIGEGYASPSVARGRLFFYDRHGDTARLTCFESETGRELWRSEHPSAYEDYYKFSGGPRTAPVVDGDRVYTYGAEGRLRCHRVKDGKLLWEVDTRERFGVVQNFFGVGSSPAIENDLLIAMVGGSPPGSPAIHSGEVKGNGSGIVAFDKYTGEVRYQVTDELASYASPVLATIDGRRWAFVFARGGLVGLDPATGKVDFHFPWRAKKLLSVNAASPVVAGNRVLITEGYSLGAAVLEVRPGRAELQWRDPRRDQSLACHWSTPVHRGGVVWGSSGESSGRAELRAVDLATGRVLWRRGELGRSTLIWADGHLIVSTEGGQLLLVEATGEGYREVARAGFGPGGPLVSSPVWNEPVLAQGLLYLRGKDRLLALEVIPPVDS